MHGHKGLTAIHKNIQEIASIQAVLVQLYYYPLKNGQSCKAIVSMARASTCSIEISLKDLAE